MKKNNRMPIISPIIEVSNVDDKTLKNCLTANFHTALDVKYAIAQVYNANYTFGTIYSSTNLSFPGAIGQEKKKPKKKIILKEKI
jgi:hypothetical protein